MTRLRGRGEAVRAWRTTTVRQHIATMARLHRQDRYNRATHDFEDIIGRAPQTVREYVEQHRDLFD
ncbi:hypothetical protein [Mycobacterium simulans]|uniref:hypothetical protein n=1 Tax=Mycobacterium simulans TaxID=627089 RepID=UPI00174DB753|nr:hypothetical protein [Mycobacterium simulans]